MRRCGYSPPGAAVASMSSCSPAFAKCQTRSGAATNMISPCHRGSPGGPVAIAPAGYRWFSPKLSPKLFRPARVPPSLFSHHGWIALASCGSSGIIDLRGPAAIPRFYRIGIVRRSPARAAPQRRRAVLRVRHFQVPRLGLAGAIDSRGKFRGIRDPRLGPTAQYLIDAATALRAEARPPSERGTDPRVRVQCLRSSARRHIVATR